MSTSRRYKRRNYFIDRKLQTKYALLTILLLVVYSFAFVAILFVPHFFSLSGGEQSPEQLRAARTILSLHKSIWPGLGFVAVAMSALSIFITHKVAGPVYRIKKVVGETLSGDLDVRIHLRKRDDLKDLALEINQLLDGLNVFVSTLKINDQRLSDVMDELERQIESGEISEASGRSLIGELKESKQNISNALDRFTVGDIDKQDDPPA